MVQRGKKKGGKQHQNQNAAPNRNPAQPPPPLGMAQQPPPPLGVQQQRAMRQPMQQQQMQQQPMQRPHVNPRAGTCRKGIHCRESNCT